MALAMYLCSGMNGTSNGTMIRPVLSFVPTFIENGTDPASFTLARNDAGSARLDHLEVDAAWPLEYIGAIRHTAAGS
jgi:hypothetical protein